MARGRSATRSKSWTSAQGPSPVMHFGTAGDLTSDLYVAKRGFALLCSKPDEIMLSVVHGSLNLTIAKDGKIETYMNSACLVGDGISGMLSEFRDNPDARREALAALLKEVTRPIRAIIRKDVGRKPEVPMHTFNTLLKALEELQAAAAGSLSISEKPMVPMRKDIAEELS